MNDSKAIRARLYVLSGNEGGRRAPVFSGYRPAFYFGEKQTDGAVFLAEGDRILPGEEAVVIIKLLHPERLGDALKKEARFVAKGGARAVAEGEVLTSVPEAVT